MRRAVCAVPLVALGLLAGAGDASAASCAFQGPGSDWHTATNWSCAKVPDAGDSVSIGANNTVTVAAAARAGSLAQTSGAIVFSNNATLAVAGAVDVGLDWTTSTRAASRDSSATSRPATSSTTTVTTPAR
jgi:hypothetical protein